MKVLIIEDELLAREKLRVMLSDLQPDLQIVGQLGSVKDSMEWLSRNPPPDLAFVDIQLSDDHSFEIFRKVPISFPVIFTTAYDKYLLDSFEFNAIDYLLKPVTHQKLQRAFDKIKTLEQHFIQGNLKRLMEVVRHQPAGKDRIVVKKGTEFIALPVKDIAYCFTEHRVVFIRSYHGHQFIADETLSELEQILDAKEFFRINRKFIANIKAINSFKPDNGKIKITLHPEVKEEIHVSKETAPQFRNWIEGI